MPGIELIGTMLNSAQPRPCGLCGVMRKPTRAHVPPQVAGNTFSVLRAPDVLDTRRSRRPGAWNEGGMWVRGLCYDCSHLSGRVYDGAYADFADQVGRLSRPLASRLQVIPGEPPGVRFAPGLSLGAFCTACLRSTRGYESSSPAWLTTWPTSTLPAMAPFDGQTNSLYESALHTQPSRTADCSPAASG